jgi:hypothetical protein
VSNLPFIGLFKDVIRILGSVFFDAETASAPAPMFDDLTSTAGVSKRSTEAESSLIAAFHEIERWPQPCPGVTLSLPLFGTHLSFIVPWSSLDSHSIDYALPGADSKGAAQSLSRSSSPASSCGHTSLTGKSASSVTSDISDTELDLHEISAASALQLPGLFQEIGLFSIFRHLVPSLWHLWQLAVTGQPLLVMASTPELCGDAVLAIVSLISPLSYCADFRPYFTLYDSDFQQIAASFGSHSTTGPRTKHGKPSPLLAGTVDGARTPSTGCPMMIGTTNPFFVKALDRWPNAAWLGHRGGPGVRGVGVGEPASHSALQDAAISHPRSKEDVSTMIISDVDALSECLPRPGEESSAPPRLVVRHAALIHPDEHVLSQLLPVVPALEEGPQLRIGGIRRPTADKSHEVGTSLHFDSVSTSALGGDIPAVVINNGILRQHFRHLTHGFLRPFEKYFVLSKKVADSISSRGPVGAGKPIPLPLSEIMAAGTSINATNRPPMPPRHVLPAPVGMNQTTDKISTYGAYDDLAALFLPRFELDAFLAHLESTGGPKHKLLRSTDWRTLYSQFVCGPHFHPWFNARRKATCTRLFHLSRTLRLALSIDDLLPSSPYAGATASAGQEQVPFSSLPPPAMGVSEASGGSADTVPAHKPMYRLTRDDLARHQDICVQLHNKIVASFVREEAFIAQDAELLQAMRGHINAVESALPSHLRPAFNNHALASSRLISGSEQLGPT